MTDVCHADILPLLRDISGCTNHRRKAEATLKQSSRAPKGPYAYLIRKGMSLSLSLAFNHSFPWLPLRRYVSALLFTQRQFPFPRVPPKIPQPNKIPHCARMRLFSKLRSGSLRFTHRQTHPQKPNITTNGASKPDMTTNGASKAEAIVQGMSLFSPIVRSVRRHLSRRTIELALFAIHPQQSDQLKLIMFLFVCRYLDFCSCS